MSTLGARSSTDQTYSLSDLLRENCCLSIEYYAYGSMRGTQNEPRSRGDKEMPSFCVAIRVQTSTQMLLLQDAHEGKFRDNVASLILLQC